MTINGGRAGVSDPICEIEVTGSFSPRFIHPLFRRYTMLDKFPDMFLFQTEIPRDFHILSHECVEIPLIVLGLFFVALLFYVASKTTVAVHIHLRIFILNLLVASAVASIFRIVSLTLVISVNQEYVHTFRRPFMALRYIAQYTGSFNLFFILCERLYATWNAHCYEQIKAVKWVFALIVFEWLLVSIYIVLSFIVKIDGIVSVFVEIVVNICILMLFTLVVGIQAYFYKKAKSKVVFRNRHSLTERYQINENFVSTKAFYPTLVFLCTITFTGTTLYAASYAIKDNDTLFVICDLLLALKLFALPILIFLSNKSLRSTLAKLVFCPRSTTICVGQACESKRISTISAADQGAVYFAELQKKWNQN
ncbi:hypothetical protein L596_008673 [Steinernema carpocapsae]|uniref:G-protein coupled receptors family 1 profile domain-containing protein n=1 Tax=Steinernema carpocapsae TaxID=34508 RepID=A0A4U5PEB3_STECR|nr:hypothetical protein L596_008673 [Steinernema carpocapsae]